MNNMAAKDHRQLLMGIGHFSCGEYQSDLERFL